MAQQPVSTGVSQDDKLWGMLSYAPVIGFVVALVALLMEDKRSRPFIKYHAVQAMAIYVAVAILSIVAVGVCVASVLWIYQIYLMIQVNKGEMVVIPFITDFCKKQGWI